MAKDKTEKKEKKEERGYVGTLGAILIFALLGIIGGIMLFIPEMQFKYFVYVTGGMFLAYGALLIIKYFAQKGFRQISNYDFSVGTVMFVLGICVIIRAADIAKSASVYLGVLVLFAGVIELQHAIQLFSIKGVMRVVNLILAAAFIACAILEITNFQNIFNQNKMALYITVFVIGILGVISQITVAAALTSFHKKEEKANEPVEVAATIVPEETLEDKQANPELPENKPSEAKAVRENSEPPATEVPFESAE